MLKLLYFPLCPYSRKVRLALAEKELAVTAEPIEPWLCREDLASGNPAGEVPVLEDRGRVIVDSWAICEYLEETQGGPSLLGRGAFEHAEVRRRDQRTHVEGHYLLVLESVGHITAHDALGQPLDDGRLADAGVADENRIILCLS
jgi:glutathione S-transferase